MSEFPVSRKFSYDLDELHTKLKAKEITEEDFSVQRDALFEQEAKAREAVGPFLITKELADVEANIVKSVNQKFQQKTQKENEQAARERFAEVAKLDRIKREEQQKQATIETENKRKAEEWDKFRSSIDKYIIDRTKDVTFWQKALNSLQITSIIVTTATASMAGADGIPRMSVVAIGFIAASLGGILSYLKLQDKIYLSRKALADLRLECQKYDYCVGDYKDRRAQPEEAYILFSQNVTEIQARHMLSEVELFKPKKDTSSPQENIKPQKEEKPSKILDKDPTDERKETTTEEI